MKRNSAPVLAASSCHGTRFEWCSSCEVRIASPGFRFARPHDHETRLIDFGRVARPDDLGRFGRVDEARDLRARPFEGVGRALGELVDAAMNVGVVGRVVVDERVDDGLRLLRRRGRVEVDEPLAARRRLREDRKVGDDACLLFGRLDGSRSRRALLGRTAHELPGEDARQRFADLRLGKRARRAARRIPARSSARRRGRAMPRLSA